MSQSAKGATPTEWQHWTALSHEDLLPLVCESSIPISALSKLTAKHLGKTPTRVTRDGTVSGIGQWTKVRASVKDCQSWARHDAHGICLQTRRLIAIDVDIDDADKAECVRDAIVADYPNVAIRCRNGSPRFVILLKCATPAKSRRINLPGERQQIELLGGGRQVVVAGTHPSGERYAWPLGLPSNENIPEVSADELDAFWDLLDMAFGDTEKPNARASSTSAPFAAVNGERMIELSDVTDRPELTDDDLVKIAQNKPPHDMDYDEWLRFVAAVHHQFEGSDAGLDFAQRWSAGEFADGPNPTHDAETTDAKYESQGRYSGRAVTMRSYMPRKPPPVEWTDLGIARQVVARCGDALRRVSGGKAWYRWRMSHWVEASEGELMAVVNSVVAQLRAEGHVKIDRNSKDGDKAAATLETNAKKYQSGAAVMGVIKQLSSQTELNIDRNEFDARSRYLGAPNGIIDLYTAKLLPADRTKFITQVTGCDFNPNANLAPVKEMMGNNFKDSPGVAEYFQRSIGYAISGNPIERKLLIMVGEGTNGKSVTLEGLNKALGDHFKTVSQETLTGTAMSSGGGAREDLVRLQGVRGGLIGETEANAVLKEAEVKAITGGDTIIARGMYAKESSEFVPVMVPIMRTNHLPIIKGSNKAIWGRILPFPWWTNYDTDTTVKNDPKIAEKVMHEMQEALLLWAVLGAVAYHTFGLANPPDAIIKLKASYREDMDLTADWVSDCVEFDAEGFESSVDLFRSFQAHANDGGDSRYVPTKRALIEFITNTHRDLKKARKRVGSGNLNGVSGLRLKAEFTNLI